MQLDLSERHALVCGASQGIGRASAFELAELGASVTVLARNADALKTVADELPRKHGQQHRWFAVDMAQTESLERVLALFPILAERRGQAAGNMSGGQQQMLAIGRALMARPRLLMLDEPSLGLAPKIVQEIFRIIGEINRAGTTVLLVEQNTRQALALAGRGYVLENGRVVLSGAGRDLLDNEHVQRAYLGM